ncbi:GPI mannosyltransferase 2 [Xylariales sp. PMI_506]|nr:GPI mannosyltransferase 2 [Xylariales sp. PMI_506]
MFTSCVHDVSRPERTLVAVFLAWKALLLLVAVGSSLGTAYDTSTTLIPPYGATPNESVLDLGAKLTRWDAIYFMQSARRGHVFEQEWAFGSGLPTVIAFLIKGLGLLGFENDGSLEPLVGIALSHITHLLSVLVLYHLGLRLQIQPQQALVGAMLHILSPAGIFLSAPYNESPFSFLTFSGLLLFAWGCSGSLSQLSGDAAIISAGIILGLATTFRSNGLLNGIPFAIYAVGELGGLFKRPTFLGVRRLAATGIGGICIAIGTIGPQALAYQVFCSGTSVTGPRPWCSKRLPSIYTFVQEEYWNVGFLRYWTLPNIPLFLLAAPMIYLLLKSAWQILAASSLKPAGSRNSKKNSAFMPTMLINSLALSQLVIAALSITNYHIQIITRISSAYPLWYFWLAQQLGISGSSKAAGSVVVFMVMYAMIQGALFASFLPPA